MIRLIRTEGERVRAAVVVHPHGKLLRLARARGWHIATGSTMGYFIGGALHKWGDPVSLLRFPKLDLISKLRYGALMFLSAKRPRWDALETTSAKDWIIRWCGRTTNYYLTADLRLMYACMAEWTAKDDARCTVPAQNYSPTPQNSMVSNVRRPAPAVWQDNPTPPAARTASPQPAPRKNVTRAQ